MKKNETDLMLEAYIDVRKKNIFVAEADDPMRVRDSGVQQYLPQRLQKGPADIKVPVKQPAPVEQVPEDNDDLHTAMGNLLEAIEFADNIDPEWAKLIAKSIFIPLAKGQSPDLEHVRQELSERFYK